MIKNSIYFLSLLVTSSLSAASETQAAPADQGMTQTLVMVAIAIAFFYFILWRPEQKRRKALDNQRSAMKKGDRVICMGVVGTVSKIKEETVVIRSGDAELEFLKAAISDVQPGTSAEEA